MSDKIVYFPKSTEGIQIILSANHLVSKGYQ